MDSEEFLHLLSQPLIIGSLLLRVSGPAGNRRLSPGSIPQTAAEPSWGQIRPLESSPEMISAPHQHKCNTLVTICTSASLDPPPLPPKTAVTSHKCNLSFPASSAGMKEESDPLHGGALHQRDHLPSRHFTRTFTRLLSRPPRGAAAAPPLLWPPFRRILAPHGDTPESCPPLSCTHKGKEIKRSTERRLLCMARA